MFRILFIAALLFLFTLGGAWLADRPGLVSLEWQDYRIESSLTFVVSALALLFVVLVILYVIGRFFWRAPGKLRQTVKRRRHESGIRIFNEGLMALECGDAELAKTHIAKAKQLLPEMEAIKLLQARAFEASGQDMEARQLYESLLTSSDLRPAALTALYQDAKKQGALEAANYYALSASRLKNPPGWVDQAVLGYHALNGDYDLAVNSLDSMKKARRLSRQKWMRLKAVLLAGKAQSLEESDPDVALTSAIQAHKLAPGLVMAASVAARLLSRKGEVRRAMRIIEACWARSLHPDLPIIYAKARPGDTVQDRLSRVKSLAAKRTHSRVGMLAVAQAAMDAGEWELARAQISQVLRSEPSRAAYVLMAQLERDSDGDLGREREYLARALTAPADPAWVEGSHIFARWTPVSPNTGKIDMLEWKLPENAEGHSPQLEADLAMMDRLPQQAAIIDEDGAKLPDSLLPEPGLDAEGMTEGDVSEKTGAAIAPADIVEVKTAKAHDAAGLQENGLEEKGLEEEITTLSPENFPLQHMPDDPGTEEKERLSPDMGARPPFDRQRD